MDNARYDQIWPGNWLSPYKKHLPEIIMNYLFFPIFLMPYPLICANHIPIDLRQTIPSESLTPYPLICANHIPIDLRKTIPSESLTPYPLICAKPYPLSRSHHTHWFAQITYPLICAKPYHLICTTIPTNLRKSHTHWFLHKSVGISSQMVWFCANHGLYDLGNSVCMVCANQCVCDLCKSVCMVSQVRGYGVCKSVCMVCASQRVWCVQIRGYVLHNSMCMWFAQISEYGVCKSEGMVLRKPHTHSFAQNHSSDLRTPYSLICANHIPTDLYKSWFPAMCHLCRSDGMFCKVSMICTKSDQTHISKTLSCCAELCKAVQSATVPTVVQIGPHLYNTVTQNLTRCM